MMNCLVNRHTFAHIRKGSKLRQDMSGGLAARKFYAFANSTHPPSREVFITLVQFCPIKKGGRHLIDGFLKFMRIMFATTMAGICTFIFH